MKLLVRLIGKGTQDDPYRASLPTYKEIATDYKAKTTVVEVPDDAICPCINDHVDNTTDITVKTTEGDKVIPDVVTAASVDDEFHFKGWYDEHYKEHADKFDVQFT